MDSDPSPQHDLQLSELLGALSHALDLTEGQPDGHCIRCCWIGVAIGREAGMPEADLWELYYTLLLKDVGCSSNAARICALYKVDDHSFKHDAKTVGDGLPQLLRFATAHLAPASGILERFRTLVAVVKQGGGFVREIITTRCERGADIARQLHFSEKVAAGIRDLDEHWDGNGQPSGKKGAAISVYARIALMAQVVDVFNTSAGRIEAAAEVARRSGIWFDPSLVAAFQRAAVRSGFWEMLDSPDIERAVLALEPARHAASLDEDFLDDIATAFAQIVDAKSTYTSGHSSRVADYTAMIAAEMDFTTARRRWLFRAALLHDIGKLGVSNLILDKPGRLTEEEWVAVRRHAALTEAVLSRISAFAELARVAGAHHERLDGKGYPRGIAGDAIVPETRVITTADIFDALTAKRPYRDAMPLEKALALMDGMVGTQIDGACLAALKRALRKQESVAA